MRVLVVTNLYPRPDDPGFGSFVARRVDALRDAGASVDVVAIRGRPGTHGTFRYLDLVARALATGIANRAPRLRYQVVEAHISYPTGLVAFPVAWIHRARLVLFVHGVDVSRLAVRSGLDQRLARSLFARASLVVANSEFMARRTIALAPSLGGRIAVWSPGFDASIFHPPSTSDRSGLLFVGRLMPEKGAAVLIRALAILREHASLDPSLTIIGQGPERPVLERLAQELGVHASFLGPLAPARVADAMRVASVVVVPSVYEEPLGLVAVEGLACGAVVVASDAGGLPEAVAGSNRAILVDPGDPTALASGIIKALETTADRAPAPTGWDAAVHGHDLARIARQSIACYAALS